MTHPRPTPQQKKPTGDRWIPYQWFWTDAYGQLMSFKAWLYSRKFSIAYLILSWGMVASLGFASTQDCDSTWQLRFACDQAIWLAKIYTDPWMYIKSWFTTAFFHNSLDHLLFVTLFGMLMPIQSFEIQHGTKATLYIFFGTYTLIGIFHGVLFNFGINHWPDSAFFQFPFERNWMGGSVGFYGIIGALTYYSKRKWALPLLVVSFALFNLTVVGISIHISFTHITSFLFGFMLCWISQLHLPKAPFFHALVSQCKKLRQVRGK